MKKESLYSASKGSKAIFYLQEQPRAAYSERNCAAADRILPGRTRRKTAGRFLLGLPVLRIAGTDVESVSRFLFPKPDKTAGGGQAETK